MARVFAVTLVGVLGTAVWWINPWRGASPGTGADPAHWIAMPLVWAPTRGTALDRMYRCDQSWGQNWYQAIWRRPEGDLLIVIDKQYGYSHMFYDYWNVSVLDRSLHVIRRGSVGMNGFPYQLIEMKADDENLLDSVRGKWFLGVKWHSGSETIQRGQEPETQSDDVSTLHDTWVVWDEAPSFEPRLWDSKNRVARFAE